MSENKYSPDYVKRKADNQLILQRSSHPNEDACLFFWIGGVLWHTSILLSVSI